MVAAPPECPSRVGGTGRLLPFGIGSRLYPHSLIKGGDKHSYISLCSVLET